jgi:hypothetical protein
MTVRAGVAVFLLSAALNGAGPEYTAAGELIRPVDYREWVFLSSGLGMTYGPNAAAANRAPLFDNVFVSPQAYKAFVKTGTWPDKTMFVLEIRRAPSEGSINKGGHFQGELVAVEVEVKDEARFAEKWAFFDFRQTAQTAKQLPKANCFACHTTNGAVDNTFVQFYPTLAEIAKAKGTFKVTPQPAGHAAAATSSSSSASSAAPAQTQTGSGSGR